MKNILLILMLTGITAVTSCNHLGRLNPYLHPRFIELVDSGLLMHELFTKELLEDNKTGRDYYYEQEGKYIHLADSIYNEMYPNDK